MHVISDHLLLQNLLQADLGETDVLGLGLLDVDLAEQHHVLTSHNEDAPGDVAIALAHVDPLDRLVEHQVCKLVDRSQVT